MTELEETLIYDALAEIRSNSVVLCELVNRCGTAAEKDAYKSGVYGPAVKLEVLLGQDALDRGRARHEKIAADCAAFFANVPVRRGTPSPEVAGSDGRCPTCRQRASLAGERAMDDGSVIVWHCNVPGCSNHEEYPNAEAHASATKEPIA
jgi:hypothetical protein